MLKVANIFDEPANIIAKPANKSFKAANMSVEARATQLNRQKKKPASRPNGCRFYSSSKWRIVIGRCFVESEI